MKTVVYRLAALKIKSFVYGKIPFPKAGMHIDRASAVPIYLQIARISGTEFCRDRFRPARRFSVRARSRANWAVHGR